MHKFPHLYRKRGGERDVSARATHLKAVTGTVPVTTIERKQMSNKTNFKRISLAVVAALGLGVLASGPSNAAVQSGATLSISAPSASIKAGETATATLTATFTGIGGNSPTYDSMSVTYVRTTGSAPGGSINFLGSAVDTVSVKAYGTGTASAWADGDTSSAVTAKFTFQLVQPTTAGSYTYTFYPAFNSAATGVTPPAPVTFSITVAAANTKPAAAQSSIYIGTWANQPQGTANLTDSTIVVTAGTIGTPAAVGYITWVQRNSDSATASPLVKESVTAVIEGAGLLNVNGNGVNGAKAGAVTAEQGETITVWSDGRTGTATIRFTTTSMTTWASKTVTFFGTATKATLTSVRSKVSKVGADSAVALRVAISDTNDKLVTSATNMYVHSSDTKVVSNGLCSVTVSATLGYGTCSLSGLVGETGTTTIKVANYAFESSAAVAAAGFVATGEATIQVVGQARQVKATFDKASYNPGNEAVIILTATDTWGAVVDTQTITGALTAEGLDFNAAGDITDTVITFSGGVKRNTYTMPTAGQTVILSYKGGAGLVGAQLADSVTALVLDPAEEAANSALDAAQEATDAAIAATDAAILAQEAADEAASAAIAAQETAQAAVDAVTALSAEVTKLVAQLATLQKLLTRVAKKVGLKI